MAINPSHIAQIAVPVRDLARARAFYGEMLGLTHLFDAPPGLSFFQCGQTRLMLSQPEGPESASGSILYYNVDDARAAQAALEEGGSIFDEDARCIARVGDKDIWLAVTRDSEGNFIGMLSEQPAVP